MPPANPAFNLDQSREVISEKPSSQPGFHRMDRSSSRADPQPPRAQASSGASWHKSLKRSWSVPARCPQRRALTFCSKGHSPQPLSTARPSCRRWSSSRAELGATVATVSPGRRGMAVCIALIRIARGSRSAPAAAGCPAGPDGGSAGQSWPWWRSCDSRIGN